MAVVMPTTLVSDAMSHSVFSSGTGDGCQSSEPAPYETSTPSRLPITAKAPGNALSALARSSRALTVSRSIATVAALGPRDVGAARPRLLACDDAVAPVAAHPSEIMVASAAQLRWSGMSTRRRLGRKGTGIE